MKRLLPTFILIGTFFVIPLIVLAEIAGGGAGGNIIQNPLKADSLEELVTLLLEVIVRVAVPVLVVLFILIGFKYVAARGNPGKIKEAHGALLWGVIGAAIVLGAFVISEILQATVDSVKGGSLPAIERLV